MAFGGFECLWRRPIRWMDLMQAKTRAPFADLAGVYKNIRHPQFTPPPPIFRLEEARGPEGGSNLKIKERSHA